ncbi:MAG: response regulator [Ruminiclostridium sp.]|nr:response regulator [Ruminiclostridium sp.]
MRKYQKHPGMFRAVAVLLACFAATCLVLQLELGRRSEEAAMERVPAFAQQTSAGVTSKVEDVASRLTTAAQVLAAVHWSQDQVTREMLDAMTTTVPFAQMGIRLPDGSAVFSDGTWQETVPWAEAQVCQGSGGEFLLGQAEVITLDGEPVWTIRLYVQIPGSQSFLFGTMALEDLFGGSFFRSFLEGDQGVVVFETATGAILLNTWEEDTLGENFYAADALTQDQADRLKAGDPRTEDQVLSRKTQEGQLYFCAENTALPGWSLYAAAREKAVTQAEGIMSSGQVYAFLCMIYAVAMVAVLLYQASREQLAQAKLHQEVSRNNTLMNAALPGSDVRVFELLPDGMIRLLTPEKGRGNQLKATLYTPLRLLTELNCSAQWEAPFLSALEQAALGQDSEIEVCTLDQEETWIQLRVEPLADHEGVEAVGTIRDVTREVQARHRQEAADKFLSRMMEGTVAGLEFSLEEDRWRMLWGREVYDHLASQEHLSYTAFIRDLVAPTVHPQDRENYIRTMERSSLISAFLSGETRRILDYRVEGPGGEYQWHSAELYYMRDSSTHQIKCNCLIHQVTESKRLQLEEKRLLEEKEKALFLRAKQLAESEDELDFVHVISEYYQGIYVVDLNEDRARSIKVPDYFSRLLAQADHCLSATMELYVETLVAQEDALEFREFVQLDRIRWELAWKPQIELTFHKRDDTWLTMRILPMSGYSQATPKTLWIFEDNTLTVKLQQEEEKARVMAQAAEAASQAKSQFLANMSHDIRTPLNAILGMSELGLREEDGEEKDNCFRDIRGSGRILLDNINSILDLSKIEAGKMELKPERYHILSVLHDAITVLSMRAQEKKLTFSARVDENIPAVLFGDDVNISHIIMNFGSNAVKYTNAGSVTLVVAWEPEGADGTLVIHMEDTGVGIRKEDMPYIFHSYGRLDRGANRHIEGTGLGLTICQNLAELMGGQIGVDSQYGVGSDFWVRIPQKVLDPTPCGPYEGKTTQENDRFVNSFTAPEAAVLVVDDQPLNLKVCQGLLRPYEMEVYTARSGQEALKQMTQVWPDLVLMDHMMPDMDGVEATRRIREMGKKDPYFAVVPIVALTANAMKGMREFFLDNGFNDFVSKPVALEALDEALRTWVPEDKQKAPSRQVILGESGPLPEDLTSLPGVDVQQGMGFCGTAEIYRKTLLMYRDQIPGKLQRIRETFREGQWEDYAIEVHSLKSASRWIGAMDLGDRAEALELAAREGRLDQVRADTPALLETYESLGEALAGVEEVSP